MTDVATLETRLQEAESALHRLLVGKSAVSVGYGGNAVSYQPGEEDRLRRYIGELKQQLGRRVRRPPLRPYF